MNIFRPFVMPLAGTAVGTALLLSPAESTATIALPDMTPVNPIIAAHGCWTGPAPLDMAGKVPGHVVVSIDGRTVYGGARMVGRALDHVFNGKYPDMSVLGFCR